MKDDLVYIEHIQLSVKRIISYTSDLSLETFLRNHIAQDAVVRQLEIIGEATKKISSNFRNQHQNIPWKDMAAMRDKLIHEYIDVDFNMVWNTAIIDIPELEEFLKKL